MTTATRDLGADHDGRAGRLGTRAALPRGRAMVGGLLVAASAVGLLVAHRAATEPHLRQWIVARHEIAVGATVRADDLALTPMDLGVATANRAFDRGSQVVGRVARTPIAAGDLVQRGAVERSAGPPGPARRVSLDLPPAQALGGALASGDRVDVLGTDTTVGTTSLIVADAVVQSVERTEDGLGTTDTVRLTIVVGNQPVAVAVVDAALRGKVTLIAATNAVDATDATDTTDTTDATGKGGDRGR